MRKLTWKLNGGMGESGVSRDDAKATLAKACREWIKAGQGELDFAQSVFSPPADIHFEFGRVDVDADGNNITAHRVMHRQAGGGVRHIVTFSDEVEWNAGGWWNRALGMGFDLRTHALHRIGIVLGLSLNDRPSSAMGPLPNRFTSRNRPDKEDAAELLNLLLRTDAQSWRE